VREGYSRRQTCGRRSGSWRCTGEVRLSNAHIGGRLSCAEAVFSNPNGQALNAAGLTIDASMSLGETRCTGEVHLFHAHIGGLLSCAEAVFSNPDGRALSASGLTVDGLMSLGEAQCTGAVQLDHPGFLGGLWFWEGSRVWQRQ
jgi:hypothetical protein